MSFEIGETPDRDDLAHFPKVARQHQLAVQGLRVPPGVVLDLASARGVFRASSESDDPALAWVREQLDAGHSLIARSAGSREDREHTSGAGLGMSVPGIHDLRELEGALSLIEAHGRTLANVGKLAAERTLMLIQREVPRRALLVVVRGGDPDDRFYVEVHGPEAGPEPLAEGRSPDWAGPLHDWDDPARAAVEELALEVAANEAGPHGVDLEIVVDPIHRAWLVQARPLTAPLEPGWPAFVAALEQEGKREQLRGSLILDGEHNPAPLSVAHAYVMERLTKLRPGKSGDPVVLAGWLYVRVLPRELHRDRGAVVMPVHDALTWLRDEALPRARAELERFEALLVDDPPIRAALERAEGLFVQMIDDYVDLLVPARAHALARTHAAARDRGLAPGSEPLTLRGRADFLDVLPAVWDISSPSLAELLDERVDERAPSELPSDEHEAARLLGEWDDHLFACGLAPLRRLWLYASARLGVDRQRVFLLAGDELVTLDEDPSGLDLEPLLATRAETWAAQQQLEPPSRIVDGHPLPHPFGGRLRGLAIGESFEGPIAQRRDLRDLLADPPPARAVLCIPSLTAQAAVALVQLGVEAVCTEYGGALAHGALMARELGLSALIGCKGCTRLPEGTQVRLDTRARRLLPLS
ncbi:MAG: PEP-utilizing enzyme [Enhygromyxa sp.]